MFPSLLLCLGIAAGCVLAGKILLHYFQLESYQFPGYFRTVRRNLLKALLPGFCMTVLLIVSLTVLSLLMPGSAGSVILCLTEALIMTAGGFVTGRLFSEKKAKKAFVFTPRVKRLYAVSLILLTAILLPAAGDICRNGMAVRLSLGYMLVFPALLPLWIALCGLLAWPVEKGISEMYFRDAQRILRERKDLIRIGITGSWERPA